MTCDPHSGTQPTSSASTGCITCGDVGVEMRVVRFDEGLAVCEDADGDARSVEISLLDGVAAGDTVLVHADVALVRLA
jgi:hydrogenase maturation factor